MRQVLSIPFNVVKNELDRINANVKVPNEFITLKKNGQKVEAYLLADGTFVFDFDASIFPCFDYKDNFIGKIHFDTDELEVFTYADLHAHTEYSILDGANTTKGLAKKVGYYGAITDHGVMYGCVDFYKQMKSLHKHPTCGIEFYTLSWKLFKALKDNKVLSEEEIALLTAEDKMVKFHLIALAKNEIGYQNLAYLSSYGQANVGGKFPTRPRISYEELIKHKEGIIILSACIGGEIPQRIVNGDMDTAKEMVQFFKDEFGDDFYLEIQRHASDDRVQNMIDEIQFKKGHPISMADVTKDYYDVKNGVIKRKEFESKYSYKLFREIELCFQEEIVNEGLETLSSEFGVKLVATTDAHYLNAEDADFHEALLCNQTKKTLKDPHHMSFAGTGYHVHTTDEIEVLFRDKPEAIINTLEVAEKCNFNFKFGEYKLPNFPIPDGYTDKEYLRKLVLDGFNERFATLDEAKKKEYMARLEFELNTIFKMGYQGYFFIVWDYIRYAKEHNIYVGPGRGSGAGSIVLYCLHITENLDPIKYDLLFEREKSCAR